jgi:UPF0716 family protein affecting phage T7 exclusion
MLLFRRILIVAVIMVPLGSIEWTLYRLAGAFVPSLLVEEQVITSILGCCVLVFAGIAQLGARRILRRTEAAEPATFADLHDNIFVLACAGALLVLPGVASDLLGFLLLAPRVRGKAVTLFARLSRWSEAV